MKEDLKRVSLSDRFVPYYYQIANLLREKIEGREYSPGDRLPGEIELARSFGVSRVPVRHALSLRAWHFCLEKRICAESPDS